VKLTRVAGRRDFRDFLALTERIYGRDPRHVSVPRQQIRRCLRGEVPGVRLYVMRNDRGETVARTTLHADPALDAKLGRPLQLFGLTEFADGDGVAEALFDAICAIGRASGKAAAFGPAGLLPYQWGGVITSGFDNRGFIGSAWNHDYYPAAYEKYGFKARFEADTWICPVAGAGTGDPGEMFGFDDARLAAEDLELHRVARRHLGRQLPILREMLNASFAQLGYYTEISAEQLARQTDGLACARCGPDHAAGPGASWSPTSDGRARLRQPSAARFAAFTRRIALW